MRRGNYKGAPPTVKAATTEPAGRAKGVGFRSAALSAPDAGNCERLSRRSVESAGAGVTLSPVYAHLRRRAGDLAVEGFLRGLSAVARLHPRSRLERHGVERIANVAYLPDGTVEHRLDVYRPIHRTGPLPVVVYIHGGGFRILSKDALWIMALMFARQGYLVYNINYRLAPSHPFPAAVSDCCAALEWVVEHAAEHGGDPTRLVLAGESAGANLATGLTLACCYRRGEPYARRIFDLGIAARAVLPACGILQVSDPSRPRHGRRPSGFLADRFDEIAEDYLRDCLR
jgi:acetyl esterase